MAKPTLSTWTSRCTSRCLETPAQGCTNGQITHLFCVNTEEGSCDHNTTYVYCWAVYTAEVTMRIALWICSSTSFRSGQVWGSKWWVSRIPNTCPERKQVCMKRRSSCWHSDDLNCSSGDRCCVSCVNAVCNSDLGLTLCLLLCTCVLHDIMCHTHILDSNVYVSSVFNSHKALSHMRTLLRVMSNPSSNQYWYMGIVTYHAMFGHVRNFAQATVCKMYQLGFGKYWLLRNSIRVISFMW